MRRLLFIAHLLAFVGGYADAASYLLTRSFAGHLTGNTVLALIHATSGAWPALLSNALAIAAFILGIIGAEWLENGSSLPAQVRQLRKPLLTESVLLLIALTCHWQVGLLGNDWCVAFLCFGMGLQNGALRRCGTVSVHTTFITGMSTSLITVAMEKKIGRQQHGDEKQHSLSTLAGVLAAFAAGAGAGAWLNLYFQAWGFVGIFLPLSMALALSWHSRESL